MKHLLMSALLWCALTASGQPSRPLSGPAGEPRFIEVTGTASQDVTPDQLFLAVTLKSGAGERPPYPLAQQEADLKQVLRTQRIELSLLTLAEASTDLPAVKKKAAPAEATKTYVVQLATAAQVSAVVQELQQRHLGESALVKTAYAGIERLQQDVRIAALKAAKAKADYLLQALGEQVDRPLEIRETREPFLTRSLTSNRLLTEDSDEAATAEAPETAFAKLHVSFSYTVKFGIK